MPEKYTVVDGDLQHSIHDKPRDLLKMALAKRDMPRINIARFERSEQQLRRTGVIRMWPGKADRNSKLLKQPDGGAADVIRGVIQHPEIVITPVRSFLVELGAQLAQEDVHGLIVGVGLEQ